MVSNRQKKIFYKLELLRYNVSTKRFEVEEQEIIEQRLLPNGMSNVAGMFEVNTEQDVRQTITLEIANHTSVNNWGADFDPNNDDTFKWWLDKRLNVYIGLQLDDSESVEYTQLGQFVIVNFTSNHDLVEFPVTIIEGASKEVLFASRRGKFLYPTTITLNAVMTETIKRILLNGREAENNILIDPQLSPKSVDLDDGSSTDRWSPVKANTSVTLDHMEFAHPESSIRIDVENIPQYVIDGAKDYLGDDWDDNVKYSWNLLKELYLETVPDANKASEKAILDSYVFGGVIAEKTFSIPANLTTMDSVATWVRCTMSTLEGDFSIRLHNQDGKVVDLPLREMVGHVIEDGTVVVIDNWISNTLNSEELGSLDAVVKMEIVQNYPFNTTDNYSIWFDKVYCASIRNMLPYDLTYNAGDNRWSAIRELAELLDAVPYYDSQGRFRLDKKKLPKERFSNEFKHDVYEQLVPKITFDDGLPDRNIYAGSESMFNEHELANHIQVLGGSSYSQVGTLVDLALYTDGIHIRERGKYVNHRGKVRAVDQFFENANPTIFNGQSDVWKIYEYHKNRDDAVKEYPAGFPHTTRPPMSNYAIEKIGDFIYHHNNASPDPVIVYAYEGKNRALWEIRKRMAHAEDLQITCSPYFILRGDDIVRVRDSLLDINDNFEIITINLPLNGDYMTIGTRKIKNLIVDIPYFDTTQPKANACWYGYDGYALTFTYPLKKSKDDWRREQEALDKLPIPDEDPNENPDEENNLDDVYKAPEGKFALRYGNHVTIGIFDNLTLAVREATKWKDSYIVFDISIVWRYSQLYSVYNSSGNFLQAYTRFSDAIDRANAEGDTARVENADKVVYTANGTNNTYDVYQGENLLQTGLTGLEGAITEALKWANSRVVLKANGKSVWLFSQAFTVSQSGNVLGRFRYMNNAITEGLKWANSIVETEGDIVWKFGDS